MEIPGFVDLQVNGYKGVDFSSPDLTEEQFIRACKELIRAGTVAFLPAIITSPVAVYRRNLKLMAQAMQDPDISNSVLGIHLEGPFISKKEGAVGAHNPEWVRIADSNFLYKLYEWSDGNIKLLTLAAEVQGAEALCRYAKTKGMTVSLGHQMSSETDLQRLANAGASSITHLGNALPHFLPRHYNPLLAGIANDNLSAMIISDGHHLPSFIIKTIVRTKGTSNVIVFSDASPIAGLPPGKYNAMGNEAILEESGRLYNPESGYLAGSSATMLDCMNYLLSLNILTVNELIELGYYNPLELIGIDPTILKQIVPTRVKKEDKFVLTDEKPIV